MHLENIVKGIITVVMWALLSVVSIGAVIEGSSFAPSISVEAMALGPLIIALFGTFIIWVLPDLVKSDHAEKIAKLNDGNIKNKRQSGGSDKLSLLMELMDEDERQAFKATLKQRVLDDTRLNADGELSYGTDTLESLFYEEEANKSLRND
jgi:hypothetical protein